ncbi:hypothetical protein MMC09_002991 [Bachmanniomyces sp. S44760]|nr:hypothetical protein [Bachmanniomyces sp. S44760]
MASRTQTFPILAPYLKAQTSTSLFLLTSVLGASTNWLLLRFLSTALANHDSISQGDVENPVDESRKIVFVSFLRDWTFWRDGAKRLGLDLSRAIQQGRLIYVDGLSGLFLPQSGDKAELPRYGEEKVTVLKDARLEELEKTILRAVQSLEGDVLLMIDGLDFLLAATEIEAQDLEDVLYTLREHVYNTVISLSADAPLIQSPTTQVEIQHAAFVVSLAHQAKVVMSLRLLDTGAARDISGVLRITKGSSLVDEEVTNGHEELEEREVLYFVQGDGGVRIFERGA